MRRIQFNESDIIFDTPEGGKLIKHFHDKEEIELVKKANIFAQPLVKDNEDLMTEKFIWFSISPNSEMIPFFEDDNDAIKKRTINLNCITRGAKTVEEYKITLN